VIVIGLRVRARQRCTRIQGRRTHEWSKIESVVFGLAKGGADATARARFEWTVDFNVDQDNDVDIVDFRGFQAAFQTSGV